MKRLFIAVLTIAMLFSYVFTVTASAEDIIVDNTYTAVCGEGSAWAWDAAANTLTYTKAEGDSWTFTFTLKGTDLTMTGFADNNAETLDDIIIPSFVQVDDATTYAIKSITGGPRSAVTIKTVVIYDGLTNINGSIFENCSGLESITIPETVTSIGSYCFKQCYALKTINLNAKITKLGRDTFYKCGELTQVTLPDTIQTLEQGVFSACSGLAQINFPASLKTIGNTCFASTALTEVNIPSTLTSIGTYAFQKCLSLTTATINSEGLTAIPEGLFNGCTALTTVEYPDTVTAIGKNAFNGRPITEFDFTKIKSIGEAAFAGTKLTEVNLPATLTSVGNAAFQNCKSLTKATINSAGLTKIPNNLFQNCSKLVTVDFPDTVTEIGQYAFYGTGFTTFDFKNVTTVGKEAFVWPANANFFPTIPATLTNIGDKCFRRDNFKGMVFLSNQAPTVGGAQGSNKGSRAKIYIPANGVGYDDAFKANFNNADFIYFGGHVNSLTANETGYDVGYTVVTIDEFGNNTTAGLQAKVMIALYDEDDTLIAAKTAVATDITTSVKTDKNAASAKIFIIDGLTSLKPLYEANEYTIQ